MDPQNSGPNCILYRDLKVLLRQSFKSLSQVYIVACSSLSRPTTCALSWIQSQQSFLGRDSILFFSIFILSRQRKLCHERSFFCYLTICLARSVVLFILCSDNLMCGYWNSYVATSKIVSRQCFYAASSNWCRDLVFLS